MPRILETVTHYQTKLPCKTAGQMEGLCCEPTAALLCCEETEKQWAGYTEAEILEHLGISLDEQGRDGQGRYVNIELEPRTKPCGERVTSYDLSGYACCDGVEPIVWDEDNSVRVIPDMSHGVVVFTGGRLPFNVSVRGSGFYLDTNNTRDAVINGRNIAIYTSTACGTARITISDGCSTAVAFVRSTNGHWTEGCLFFFYEVSGSGIQSKYRLAEFCPQSCSITIGGTIYQTPPPSTNITVNCNLRRWSEDAGGGWLPLGDSDCAISDLNIMDSKSFYDALALVTIAKGGVLPTEPPDETNECLQYSLPCKFEC